MAFGDSDLGAIFDPAVFGVPVVWNSLTIIGVLDVYTDEFRRSEGPGGFQTTEYLLRLPTPALQGGSPKAFDTVTIADNPNLPDNLAPGTYTVKTLPQCRDSSICELILKGPA